MLLLSLTPLLAVEVPRFLAFWPLIISLVMSGWMVFGLKEKLVIPKTYIICAGAISALALISCLWSIAPDEAIKDAIKISAILGFGALWIGLCNSIDIKNMIPFLQKIPFVFFTLTATLILAELLLDMPLYRIIRGLETNEYANPSEMNRAIVCLVMYYFIAIGFIQQHILPIKKLRISLFLFMTALLLSIFLIAESQSAQVAFLIGLIVLVCFPSKPDKAYALFAFIIIATIALTPLIVDSLYGLFVVGYGQELPWFKDAYAGNRAEIWHFVTLHAMHNPLYGYGVEATRYIEHFEHAQIYHKSNTVLHPHNFAVQIWIEFGAIGVVIFSMLIYKAFIAIKNTDIPCRKYLLATIAPVILVSSVAYGMWQSWWLGYIIFISGIAILMNRSILPASILSLNSSS